jgi:uncharacterized MAPEG superfamily protein
MEIEAALSGQNQMREAAKITVAFTTLYFATFMNVLITKRTLLRQANQENKVFDRYGTSPGTMQNADRLNANFLEWSPIFLGLLWSLASTAKLDDTCAQLAWTYVGLRTLYIGMLLKYGVASDGMNKALWISTLPGYICLVFLWQHANAVFVHATGLKLNAKIPVE